MNGNSQNDLQQATQTNGTRVTRSVAQGSEWPTFGVHMHTWRALNGELLVTRVPRGSRGRLDWGARERNSPRGRDGARQARVEEGGMRDPRVLACAEGDTWLLVGARLGSAGFWPGWRLG